jgi:predicted nucleotidyltransferase
MKSRHGVDTAQKQELRALLRERLAARPEVRFAYVHGSFLERETLGDVDVAVSVEPGSLLGADVTSYELTLEGVLGLGLRVPIEVRVLEDAPVSFQYAVTRGDTLFVRDAEAWAVSRERTWTAYLDFAPLREEALRDLAGRVLPSTRLPTRKTR